MWKRLVWVSNPDGDTKGSWCKVMRLGWHGPGEFTKGLVLGLLRIIAPRRKQAYMQEPILVVRESTTVAHLQAKQRTSGVTPATCCGTKGQRGYWDKC